MRKQRIGNLTFYNTLNYGAALQCFSLNRFLREAGYDCSVIRYDCAAVRYREMPQYFFKTKDLKKMVKGMLSFPYKVKKKKNFDAFFHAHIPHSDQSYNRQNIENANQVFDTFLFGSDQIWNPVVTKSDLTFYADFAGEDKRKVAYAASFGDSYAQTYYSEEMRAGISRFHAISVREKKGADFVRTLTGKNCTPVCDPVFLTDRQTWCDMQKTVPTKKKYVLVYFIHYDYNRTMAKAKEFAKEQGYDVIYINNTYKLEKGVINYRSLGPQEFLYLINHAEAVVTGSFHGLCFSLIFRKRVFFEMPKTGTSRLSELATLVGLQDKTVDNLNTEMPFNYEKVSHALKPMIEGSKAFLKNALQEKEH